METDTFSNDEVASFLNFNFICIRIDFEKNSDLVAMYDIPGFPTVLLLSAEGEELGRIMGYKPPDIFMIEASPYVSTS